MDYSEAYRGLLVKFTPRGRHPALLRPEHPGVINAIIESSTYVMVDWARREGTTPQYGVFEVADLSIINDESEYVKLAENVRKQDEIHGAPPLTPNQQRIRDSASEGD